MYRFSVAKLFVFNIALGFLFGAGSFLALRALSFRPAWKQFTKLRSSGSGSFFAVWWN